MRRSVLTLGSHLLVVSETTARPLTAVWQPGIQERTEKFGDVARSCASDGAADQ